MKIERTKNASKSMKAGFILRIYQMLTPFLMRTAMIYFMGVQYLGLNSLFASILQILNLAELGVGSAMVFSMYRPIAEDDRLTICALMKLYRKYYRLIGLVIGGVGLALTPAVPHLISGEIPGNLNIYVLYWLNLGATVLTYWLFAYKNCLLQAHQRLDVSSLVTVFTTTVQYVIQVLVMIFLKDYYLYIIVALLTQAMNNVITAVCATKMFPEYSPCGDLGKEQTKVINRRIRDLFTGKLGSVILNSADSVVISAFLGLAVLAVYQNYYFMITSVIGIIEVILQSVMAGLGNSYVTESKEKNYNDLEKFTFLFLWLVGVCTCCFLGLYQPFMELWVGQELMLGYGAVICFAVYFFIYCLNRLLNIYKDAAGLWHEDRFRPLVTAGVNLLLNLLLVHFIGIYGVLLSTVFSMLAVGMPWLLKNIFTIVFDRNKAAGYLKLLAKLVAVTALCAVLVCLLCSFIRMQLWLTLLVRAAVCAVVPNVIFYFALRGNEQFRPCVQLLDRLTKEKLKLDKRLFAGNERKKTQKNP